MSVIKSFSVSDIDPIHAIEVACNPFPWSRKTLQGCFGPRYITRGIMVDNQWCGFYVADYVVDEMTLMEIAIHPSWQRRGYGNALLNDLFHQADKLNIRQCFLEVRASNFAAQLLYINHDFSQIDRRTGYYPAQTGHEDAIIMRKSLDVAALIEK
ncbi:ribosomal-protein-alanine N-acetyltransferase [Thalassotalea litorea]|uniref:[Ribosomal protein bS18]-alanine N-acetyltransferase n=1 Tax=Thalassotalea litorea TaxID=2020715 RepID=A0A5R9IG93_9GAMM|nr:ribosomal protein S18-alanine N-acetyltransferase [Thalassotalea litorea]TLU61670.1 ribosomal-protein-alanine N-acetyltransferase [Thalassotalea litorea]